MNQTKIRAILGLILKAECEGRQHLTLEDVIVHRETVPIMQLLAGIRKTTEPGIRRMIDNREIKVSELRRFA